MSAFHQHSARPYRRAANVFGGAIMCSALGAAGYLRYSSRWVGIHARYRLVEMVPEVWSCGRSAAFLTCSATDHSFSNTLSLLTSLGEERMRMIHPLAQGFRCCFGLIIHTFFDGIAIAPDSWFQTRLGWIIFFAVFCTKFPKALL